MRLRNIDRYIQSKLQNFRPNLKAKDDIWSNIESELDSQKPAPASRAFSRIAAAVVVLVALLPIYRYSTHYFSTAHKPVAQQQDNNSSKTASSLAENRHITANTPTQTGGISSNKTALSPLQPMAENTVNRTSGNPINDNRSASESVKSVNSRYQYNSTSGTPDDINTTGFNSTITNTQPGTEGRSDESYSNSGINTVDVSDIYAASLQTYKNIVDENTRKSMKMQLADRPILLASVKGRRALVKKLDEKNLPSQRNAIASQPQYWDNWQSIYYHFWDNPAYTGLEGRYNLTIDDQVTKTDNSLRPDYTNHFAFDMQIPRFGVGLGVYHQRDVGITSLNTRTGLAASVHLLSLGDGELTGGASANFIQRNSFSKLFLFSKNFDPVFGFVTDKYDHFSHSVNTIAYSAGLWYSSSNTIMGLDVQNINNPVYGGTYDATKIPTQWRATFGYRVEAGRNFQFMPWIEATRLNDVNVFTTRLMAVYRSAYMLGVGYEGIDAQTHLGNLTLTGSVQVKRHFRLFASYGKNLAMVQNGVDQNILYGGLRVQLH
jgi:hypothetical protein